MPADCSLSCAGPFLQFAQECQAIIAAMPIAGELNALVDKCHAAGGVASGGCPCGDVAQKAEVDSLRERLANRDATIDHLSGLLQMVGERMEGVEARVHLLEMEESQLGQNHCLARVNPDDPTAPSTMSGTNGDIDAYCTDECPCGEGEGDCDTSSQCAGGLVCEEEHVLRVGRACPSWMRPDAECCYNIGHASGRDQCAGLSEGAPCDDANAVSCSLSLVCRVQEHPSEILISSHLSLRAGDYRRPVPRGPVRRLAVLPDGDREPAAEGGMALLRSRAACQALRRRA